MLDIESELKSLKMDSNMGASIPVSNIPISYDCHLTLSRLYTMIQANSIDPIKVMEVIDKSSACDIYSDLSLIRSTLRHEIGFPTIEALRTHGVGPIGERTICLALSDHLLWVRSILGKRFDSYRKRKNRGRLDCSHLTPGI